MHQLLAFLMVLATADNVALDHDANDGALPGADLGGGGGGHLHLLVWFSGAICVAAIDHDYERQTGFAQQEDGFVDMPGGMVRAGQAAAAKRGVSLVASGCGEDSGRAFAGEGGETMRMRRSTVDECIRSPSERGTCGKCTEILRAIEVRSARIFVIY